MKFLLISLGVWETLLTGRDSWLSSWDDCCRLSGHWGVLIRGGTCGAWSLSISSEVSAGEKLRDKAGKSWSTEDWRPGGESSGSAPICERAKIPHRRDNLCILGTLEQRSRFDSFQKWYEEWESLEKLNHFNAWSRWVLPSHTETSVFLGIPEKWAQSCKKKSHIPSLLLMISVSLPCTWGFNSKS